jgi:hypothetical protein
MQLNKKNINVALLILLTFHFLTSIAATKKPTDWPNKQVNEYEVTAAKAELLNKVSSVKIHASEQSGGTQHLIVTINQTVAISGVVNPYKAYLKFTSKKNKGVSVNICTLARTGVLIKPDKAIASTDEVLQKALFQDVSLLLANGCDDGGQDKYRNYRIRLFKFDAIPENYLDERSESMLDAATAVFVKPDNTVNFIGFKNFQSLIQTNKLTADRVNKFDESNNSVGRVSIDALYSNPFKYQNQVVSVIVAMSDMASATEVLVGDSDEYKPDYVSVKAVVEKFNAKDWNKNTRWLMAVKVIGKNDTKSSSRYSNLTRLQLMSGVACEQADCSDWKPSKIAP